MKNRSMRRGTICRRSFTVVLVVSIAAASLLSQTQIVYHSFSTGTFKSAGNSAVLTSILGQSVVGESSGNGVTLSSGYSAFGKGMTMGVTRGPERVPEEFVLYQNYPNPFNPVTIIAFTLKTSGLTTMKVFDILGKEVAVLLDEHLESGVHYRQTFDASRFASGIYIVRLQSGEQVQLKKMMFLK